MQPLLSPWSRGLSQNRSCNPASLTLEAKLSTVCKTNRLQRETVLLNSCVYTHPQHMAVTVHLFILFFFFSKSQYILPTHACCILISIPPQLALVSCRLTARWTKTSILHDVSPNVKTFKLMLVQVPTNQSCLQESKLNSIWQMTNKDESIPQVMLYKIYKIIICGLQLLLTSRWLTTQS